MFIDKARIMIKAGDGGNGAVSFHREKYVAAGGPDGGDGGRGGDVVFVVDSNVSTLIDFKYKRKYVAKNGNPGETNNRTGRSAENLIVKVPKGTVIRDFETKAIIADMSGTEPVVIAKGGKGGFGNSHFANPTRQVPTFAKLGIPGEKLEVFLELKLVADVGLVGFPNVGKSTIISAISAAKPKIANYHFTTLSPVLGVVKLGEGSSFVVADIPGLIEGASDGVGLGHEFLRHVERCRMIVHVVDVSGTEGRDPIQDYETINKELFNFSEELAKVPQIVVGNKSDIATEEDVEKFENYIKSLGLEYISVSAATTKNLDKMVSSTYNILSTLPPVLTYEPNYVKPLPKIGRAFEISVEEEEFVIDAPWLEKILKTTDISDYESLQYFQRAISDSGINDKLLSLGIKEGDQVRIGEYQFDYVE